MGCLCAGTAVGGGAWAPSKADGSSRLCPVVAFVTGQQPSAHGQWGFPHSLVMGQ